VSASSVLRLPSPAQSSPVAAGQAYGVLRHSKTERPFSSELNDEKRPGVYACAACGTELFSSTAKFDSGSGWPSFFDKIDAEVTEDNVVDKLVNLRQVSRGPHQMPCGACFAVPCREFYACRALVRINPTCCGHRKCIARSVGGIWGTSSAMASAGASRRVGGRWWRGRWVMVEEKLRAAVRDSLSCCVYGSLWTLGPRRGKPMQRCVAIFQQSEVRSSGKLAEMHFIRWAGRRYCINGCALEFRTASAPPAELEGA
jgi:peptide methionine sulfoxide reductase MsrB